MMPQTAMRPPLAALITMWWLMMMAMMVPSAAPAVLLFARVREHHPSISGITAPWLFVLGYVLVWLLFSVIAAVVQKALAGSAMAPLGRPIAGGVLIAAGAYQLSPLKAACLRHCRSPTQFLTSHWRPGISGAVRLGMLHGAYCLGCCWLLMALLFVGGVMNFIWIAGLTLAVAAEKLVPRGEWLGRIGGIALVVWGALILYSL